MASLLLGITRKPIYYPTAVVTATSNYTTSTTVNGIQYTTHIFTSSGILSIYDAPAILEICLVGGGGGGGGYLGGGGGAGGFIWNNYISIPPGIHTVSVGAGGGGGGQVAGFLGGVGYPGSNSSIGNSIIAFGGGAAGGGESVNETTYNTSQTYNGGSGGGQGRTAGGKGGTIGSPLQPNYYQYGVGKGALFGQGNRGGAGSAWDGVDSGGGGGGGAFSTGTAARDGNGVYVGSTGLPGYPGNGGTGTFTSIISTTLGISLSIGQYITATNALYFAGGGGGGGGYNGGFAAGDGIGGTGGGGRGSTGTNRAESGMTRTGGGGGAGSNSGGGVSDNTYSYGGSGGSGIVMVRYQTSLYTSTIRTINSPPIVVDPYFNYNTFLLSGQTTSSIYLNNSSIVDTSYNSTSSNLNTATITSFPTPGPVSPFGTTWSTYFIGSGNYLNIPTSSLSFGASNDFTVEAWVNWPSIVSSNQNYFSTTGTTRMILGRSSTGYRLHNNGIERGFNYTFSTSSWYHLALVRSSGIISVYINGTLSNTPYSDTTNWIHTATTVGANIDATEPLTGYVSNLRVVNTTAVYTTDFNVPTGPLPGITNTVLLTCANNRFTDINKYQFTATNIVGTPKIVSYSPFPKNQKYNTWVNGGSVYIDASNDQIYWSLPAVLFSNFTIDFWVYPMGGYGGLFIGTNQILFYNSNPIAYTKQAGGGGSFVCDATFGYTIPYSWNHIVFTREGLGASQTKIYINGILAGLTTVGMAESQSASNCGIGSDRTGNSTRLGSAYISNFRYVRSAVYPSSNTTIGVKYFEPITPSLTTDTTTSTALLMNGTSAGVVDLTLNNNLRDIKPQGSILFTTSSCLNITSSYLVTQSTATFGFGTGNFTVELWMYQNTTTTAEYVLYESTTTNAFTLFKAASGNLSYKPYGGAAVSILPAANIPINSWMHVAVSRSDGIIRSFINGTTSSYAANSTNFVNPGGTNQYYTVGGRLGGTVGFPGNITNLRVVKGIGLYTSNFVPLTYPLVPTSSFTTATTDTINGNTILLLKVSNSTITTDYSPNAFTLTSTGSPTYRARVTPFTTATIISQTVDPNQGSIFLGTNVYLSTSTNNANLLDVAANQDFTFECWYYHISPAGMSAPTILANYNGFGGSSFAFWPYRSDFTAGKMHVGFGGNIWASTAAAIFGAWTHVAIVRSGGATGTVKLYVNGMNYFGFTQTSANALSGNGLGVYIGTTGDSISGAYFNGYISNLRWVTGTAVYTGDFIPSTAPLTAISNTKLLLNTVIGNTYKDSSSNNVTLTENGSSTSTVSFNSPFSPSIMNLNSRCLFFSGSGQYLASAPSTPTNSLGAGDFTIEMWIYILSLNTSMKVLSQGSYTTGEYHFTINSNTTGIFTEASTTKITFTAGSFQPGRWIHVSICRAGSVIRGFLNGTLNVSDSSTYNYSAVTAVFIGSNTTTIRQDFHGYMDDLRISVGIGRYIDNFSRPTKAPPLK